MRRNTLETKGPTPFLLLATDEKRNPGVCGCFFSVLFSGYFNLNSPLTEARSLSPGCGRGIMTFLLMPRLASVSFLSASLVTHYLCTDLVKTLTLTFTTSSIYYHRHCLS